MPRTDDVSPPTLEYRTPVRRDGRSRRATVTGAAAVAVLVLGMCCVLPAVIVVVLLCLGRLPNSDIGFVGASCTAPLALFGLLLGVVGASGLRRPAVDEESDEPRHDKGVNSPRP